MDENVVPALARVTGPREQYPMTKQFDVLVVEVPQCRKVYRYKGIKKSDRSRTLKRNAVQIVIKRERDILAARCLFQLLGNIASTEDQQKMVLRQTVDDGVVSDPAILGEDKRIHRLADVDLGHVSRQKVVDHGQGVRPLDVNFPQT